MYPKNNGQNPAFTNFYFSFSLANSLPGKDNYDICKAFHWDLLKQLTQENNHVSVMVQYRLHIFCVL